MKKVIYYLWFVLIFAGTVVFVLYYFNIVDFRFFPEPEGAKKITLECNYNNQDIELDYTLYQSIDDFYGDDRNKESYQNQGKFSKYVFSYPEDSSLAKLADKIEAKGREMGFTKDQTADLANCFVQNIPYDQKKADLILSGSFRGWQNIEEKRDALGRFPYETLYDNKGICTDKSYLAAYFLKEMGYGSAIFTFDKEKHMAIGINTPKEYSSFNTDYAYIETTAPGYKVGQLPIMDDGSGGAKKQEIQKIDPENVSLINANADFSPPSTVDRVSEGREYRRIIEITKTNKKIRQLANEISSLSYRLEDDKKTIKKKEAEIIEMEGILSEKQKKAKETEKKYRENPTRRNYNIYLKAYDNYENYYASYKSSLEYYNFLIDEYNKKIKKLNSYIDEYNKLVKKD